MGYRFSIRTLLELTAIFAITISLDRAVLGISALREYELLIIAGIGAATGIYVAFRRSEFRSVWKLLTAIAGWTAIVTFANALAMAIQYGIVESAGAAGPELAPWYWSSLPALFVAVIAVVFAVAFGAIPAVIMVRKSNSRTSKQAKT